MVCRSFHFREIVSMGGALNDWALPRGNFADGSAHKNIRFRRAVLNPRRAKVNSIPAGA